MTRRLLLSSMVIAMIVVAVACSNKIQVQGEQPERPNITSHKKVKPEEDEPNVIPEGFRINHEKVTEARKQNYRIVVGKVRSAQVIAAGSRSESGLHEVDIVKLLYGKLERDDIRISYYTHKGWLALHKESTYVLILTGYGQGIGPYGLGGYAHGSDEDRIRKLLDQP